MVVVIDCNWVCQIPIAFLGWFQKPKSQEVGLKSPPTSVFDHHQQHDHHKHISLTIIVVILCDIQWYNIYIYYTILCTQIAFECFGWFNKKIWTYVLSIFTDIQTSSVLHCLGNYPSFLENSNFRFERISESPMPTSSSKGRAVVLWGQYHLTTHKWPRLVI